MNDLRSKAIGLKNMVARVLQHPSASFTTWQNSDAASDKTKHSNFSNAADGQNDAYRHTLWIAESRRQLAELNPKATQDELDTAMREAGIANETERRQEVIKPRKPKLWTCITTTKASRSAAVPLSKAGP